MIYEFRTYRLHPGTLPEFLKRFGDALPRRERLSPMAAFWFTEIGPLNQVVHVWPYENVQERSKIRAEAVKAGIWPPDNGPFIAEMRSELFDAMPFGVPLAPSNDGPFFEMRIRTLKAFTIPVMAERWKERFPARAALSPSAGVFASDIGELNQWMDIWSYKSLDERTAVQEAAAAKNIWPPDDSDIVIHESTKILRAAPFSMIK